LLYEIQGYEIHSNDEKTTKESLYSALNLFNWPKIPTRVKNTRWNQVFARISPQTGRKELISPLQSNRIEKRIGPFLPKRINSIPIRISYTNPSIKVEMIPA